MAGPLTEEEEFEFRARLEREMGLQKPLRTRWREAKDDPERRAELAKEIGQKFASEYFEGPRGGLEAFMKTTSDVAWFGLGRNKLQREARKAFPGMSVEESRIVAQEIERIQPIMKPLETGLGGALGVAGSIGGGMGLVKGGARAVSRLPQAAQNVIGRNVGRLGFRRATPTPKQLAAGQSVTLGQRAANLGLNLGRGAAAGVGGQMAYEAVGEERAPGLDSDYTGAAILGGLAPMIPAAGSAVAKRLFFPTRAARDVIEERVGPAGAQLARQYIEATGEPLPVAAAALDKSSGARIAPTLPGPEDAAEASQRAYDAMTGAARRRILRDLPPGSRQTAESIRKTTEEIANLFMSSVKRQRAGGIPATVLVNDFNNVLTELEGTVPPNQLRALRDLFQKRSRETRGGAASGDLTLDEFDNLRRAFNELAEQSVDPSVAFKVREAFGPAIQKVNSLFPGYDASVVSGFARGMRAAEGAEAAPAAFRQTPEAFRRTVTQNIPAEQLPERLEGLALALSEQIRSGSLTPDAAIKMMRTLSSPDIAENVRFGLANQRGAGLPRAAPEMTRGAEATQRLAVRDIAALRNPQVATMVQALNTQGTYFRNKTLMEALSRMSMSKAVRNEIMDLLSNPERSAEGVAAMMRAQARGQIPELSSQGMRRLLNRSLARGETAKQMGMMVGDDYYEDNLPQGDTRTPEQVTIDNAMGVVNRAVYELRGSQEPMSDEEFYGAEAMMKRMIADGMSPEEAIDQIIRIHTRPMATQR